MMEWITVIAGFVYLIVSILGYQKEKTIAELSWIISSLGFLITAIALAIWGLGALSLPGAIYLGTLYPSFLALGILYKKGELGGVSDVWKYYFYLIVLVFILMAIGQAAFAPLTTISEVSLHVISGLIIVFLPLVEFIAKRWDYRYLFFTLGGLVIGIGGIALATIVAGAPMLPFDLVVLLLHPLLFTSAFLIAIAIFLISQK